MKPEKIENGKNIFSHIWIPTNTLFGSVLERLELLQVNLVDLFLLFIGPTRLIYVLSPQPIRAIHRRLCGEGTFQHRHANSTQSCRPCTTCPQGFGVIRQCSQHRDTVCQPCVPGETYSVAHSTSQECLPCSTCNHRQVTRNCTRTVDRRCGRCFEGRA